MAFIAPVIAAVGGASGAIAIAGAGLGAIASAQAGKAQSRALREEAKVTRLAAEDRELSRKRMLVKALASQRAGAAGRGVIASGGSVGAVAVDSASQYALDKAADRFNTATRISSLNSQARSARSLGALRGLGTLINQAARTTNRGGYTKDGGG